MSPAEATPQVLAAFARRNHQLPKHVQCPVSAMILPKRNQLWTERRENSGAASHTMLLRPRGYAGRHDPKQWRTSCHTRYTGTLQAPRMYSNTSIPLQMR